MRPLRISLAILATTIATAPVMLAQAQAPPKGGEAGRVQTFTGCLMTEPDYRKAHYLGRGSVAGAGLGDEYVLVDVKVPTNDVATGSSTAGSTTSSTSTDRPAGTAANACADQGAAYRLTGSEEKKLKPLVGHQVEVQGRVKHAAETLPSGLRPGDPLPAEIEIVSFREARGSSVLFAMMGLIAFGEGVALTAVRRRTF